MTFIQGSVFETRLLYTSASNGIPENQARELQVCHGYPMLLKELGHSNVKVQIHTVR